MHDREPRMIVPLLARITSTACVCIAVWMPGSAELAIAQDAAAYCLVTSCTNAGAGAEVYAPDRICHNGSDEFFNALQGEQRGLFALDLNAYGKGKAVEPINIRAAEGNSGIIVDQFTRGLPPTEVPKTGGTVSFDKRFGEDMKCSPLFETSTLAE